MITALIDDLLTERSILRAEGVLFCFRVEQPQKDEPENRSQYGLQNNSD